MKTTILSMFILLSIPHLFGQLADTSLQHLTFLRNSNDSLVHSLEDILSGASKDERLFVENMKDWMVLIDDEREVRNMFDLYGIDNQRIDSAFAKRKFPEMIASYIDDYLGNHDFSLDSNRMYLEKLKGDYYGKSKIVHSNDQVWYCSDFAWQFEGTTYLSNYPDSYEYYIEGIAFSDDQVKIDSTNKIFQSTYLDQDYKESITSQIEGITYPYAKYNSYIFFMENLSLKHLTPDLIETATHVSELLVNDYSIDLHFKIESLIAISKILCTDKDESLCQLAMTNYGRLYGIIGEDYPAKKHYVQRMELQMLNRLASLYPRKNRFVMEGFEVFHELLSERNSVYTEGMYFEDNLALAELLVNQLRSHNDPDYKFSQKDQVHFDGITQWRILNIIYEFKKFERINGPLPKHYHTRLFKILSDYYICVKDQNGLVRTMFTELKSQKGNSEYTYDFMCMMPDLLYKLGEIDESKKWAAFLDGYVTDELFGGAISNSHELLDGILTRPPSSFIKGDKKYWLSSSSDTIIDSYIELINGWRSIPIEFKEMLKPEAYSYFEFDSFFVLNQEYKKAYVCRMLGDLARGNEDDSEKFTEMISSKNDAHSQTRNATLNRKNSILRQETLRLTDDLDSLSSTLIQKNDLLNRKQKELEQKELLIQKKNARLNNQDSIISARNNDIGIANNELAHLTKEKERIQIEKQELLIEYDIIQEEYGTLENQKRKIQSTLEVRNILIGFLILLVCIVLVAFWFAWKNKKRAEENANLVKLEKDNVEKERNIAEGLRQSIGQIGHLCEKGITNIVNEYFRFSKDEKVKEGRLSLNHLSKTFRKFRTNRENITSSIENEVDFAIELLFSQKPQFCKGKSKDDLLSMISYDEVRHESVPSYTVVNVINNFFKHSVLDKKNKLVVSSKIKDNIREITLHCYANQDPKRGGEKEGTEYCNFMIKTVYGGDDPVFTHYPIGENEYINIMKLKSAS